MYSKHNNNLFWYVDGQLNLVKCITNCIGGKSITILRLQDYNIYNNTRLQYYDYSIRVTLAGFALYVTRWKATTDTTRPIWQSAMMTYLLCYKIVDFHFTLQNKKF